MGSEGKKDTEQEAWPEGILPLKEDCGTAEAWGAWERELVFSEAFMKWKRSKWRHQSRQGQLGCANFLVTSWESAVV